MFEISNNLNIMGTLLYKLYAYQNVTMNLINKCNYCLLKLIYLRKACDIMYMHMHMHIISGLGRWKQEDQDFKVICPYIMSLRSTKDS